MSTIDSSQTQLAPPPMYFDARAQFAAHYLSGEGLEIGPLHQPLAVPAHVRKRNVDRMSAPDLRREYPELAGWDLTDVDVIDDGETLATIAAESQDFIVANHFLEHTENPIGTIETHLSKLKPGGILFYAVPDKRYTFDFRRPVTPLEHMVADYEDGPGGSRGEHYEEWCRLVINEESSGTAEEAASEEWVAQRARELESAKYSIHMHVWTQAEFLRLILDLRQRFDQAFDLQAAAAVAIEFIVVLRKAGPLPPPAPVPGPAVRAPISAALEPWELRGRRVLGRARREARRRRTRP